MDRIIPSLYINITEKCNMKCEYCPAYGENWESTEGLMDLESLLSVVRIAHSRGIVSYRISGGEPMIFPKRVFAIINTLNALGVNDIILNTNGYNLYNYMDELKGSKFRKIKISLDTLDRELFEEITGTNKLDDVIRSIMAVKELNLIPLELNMVVLKKNMDHVWSILDFCVENNISLKLLDLVKYESFTRNPTDPDKYFDRSYVDFDTFTPEFEKRFGAPITSRLTNNRGIPMLEYKISETATLTLKNSLYGSTFADLCKSCPIFPCQEGLFHLSLSASGNITPCRLRRDVALDLANRSADEIANSIDETILAYRNPFFVEHTVDFQV